MTIIEDRLAQPIHLSAGGHNNPDAGEMCLLEAAAWIAGEPWTAHPECVCPVLAAFGRAWNDALPDADRDRILLPFLPLLIGTRTTPDMQDRRAFMATDWAVRVFTPTWLDLAGLDAHAAALRSLPILDSVESCQCVMPTVEAAWEAAWEAAREAAGVAAREAAWEAAREAAWEAAWEAAREAAGAAAREAAGVAAGEAAREAAGAAATVAVRVAFREAFREAARKVLASTVATLQESAADLYHRMITLDGNPT